MVENGKMKSRLAIHKLCKEYMYMCLLHWFTLIAGITTAAPVRPPLLDITGALVTSDKPIAVISGTCMHVCN